MPRRKNPWKRPASLSADQLIQLSRYLAAFDGDESERKCCALAFGNEDAWRKNAFDILSAAHARGFLKVTAPPEIELAAQLEAKYALNFASVVDVDTTEAGGQRLFGRHSALVFLERLRYLHSAGDGRIDVAVGGGESVHSMLEGLRHAVPTDEYWFMAAQKKIHLWTPTVGHLQDMWDYASLAHVVRLGELLGLPSTKCHPLFGPAFFREEDLPAYRGRSDVKNAGQAKDAIKLIVTSCGAGHRNYCLKAMEQVGASSADAAGEMLYNLYDDEGQVIHCSAPMFTLFPDSTISARISESRRANEPFISLGLVYGTSPNATEAKARALRAAIAHESRAWLTDVVCTAAIARELVNR